MTTEEEDDNNNNNNNRVPNELDLLAQNRSWCEACPEGGVCLGDTYVWNIAPEQGYWIVPWSNPNTAPTFAKCPLRACD